jgi:hypothetical protein
MSFKLKKWTVLELADTRGAEGACGDKYARVPYPGLVGVVLGDMSIHILISGPSRVPWGKAHQAGFSPDRGYGLLWRGGAATGAAAWKRRQAGACADDMYLWYVSSFRRQPYDSRDGKFIR